MASKLCIQKDWVIVIAHSVSERASDEKGLTSGNERDKAKSIRLASINATVRRFDLMTSILAPLVSVHLVWTTYVSKN